jgi:hypothetical protein
MPLVLRPTNIVTPPEVLVRTLPVAGPVPLRRIPGYSAPGSTDGTPMSDSTSPADQTAQILSTARLTQPGPFNQPPIVLGPSAPGATAIATATASTVGTCWSLFSDDPTCWGPVGSKTALVAAGVALVAFFFFGGKRR